MQEELTTTSAKQTQGLGETLAKELKGGEVICLSGELGSGKTTFTQGILKGLEADGPYTSPTFVIMKKYQTHLSLSFERRGIKGEVYHFDAYRVEAEDVLNLGWEEIIADPHNVVIVEWADRIKKIIPSHALWIRFEGVTEDKRKIFLTNELKNI